MSGNPVSGTLWIRSGGLAGHYVIASSTHYVIPEELGTAPRTDFTGYTGFESQFGTKAAFDDLLPCMVVSRWKDTPRGDFTVYAPLQVARVS